LLFKVLNIMNVENPLLILNVEMIIVFSGFLINIIHVFRITFASLLNENIELVRKISYWHQHF